MAKKNEPATTLAEEEVVTEEVVKENDSQKETGTTKNEVEAKIRKQIEKKQEKDTTFGIYRIGQYLKEEHKWENWLFLAISIITMVLGGLLLNGALIVRSDFPFFGEHPDVLGWILFGFAGIGLLYALYPFFKPAFPEFKKITWLSLPNFIGNSIRTFLFIGVFTGLFILYDSFITELLALIF